MPPKRKNGTKRHKNREETTEKASAALAAFDHLNHGCAELLRGEEFKSKSRRETITAIFDEFIGQIPREALKMTMAELKAAKEERLKESGPEDDVKGTKEATPENQFNEVIPKAIAESVNYALADVAQSRVLTQPKKNMRAKKTRTHSAVQKTTSLQQYTTPLNRLQRSNSTCVVTPKFNPKYPPIASTLRKPRPGEVVMSLDGSPLQIDPALKKQPDVLLTLRNGNVISVADHSTLEDLNSPLQSNLKQLHQTISTLLKKNTKS